jgi:hypothetical protein
MIPYLKIFIFIFIVIMAIIPTLLFAMLITPCGGRECCGRRFCPIGLADDYSSLLVGIELLLIIAFITIGISVRI